MKHAIAYLVCVLAGIGIGWHFGQAHAIFEYQRDVRPAIEAQMSGVEAQMDGLNKQRDEDLKVAKPWEASTASIALAALKNLETNDVEGAKFRLATMVATYYRGYSGDGDTNLLNSIVTFAAKDTVLSNAIYGKFH